MAWDIDNSKPVYQQIIDTIRNRIVVGTYPDGSHMPSVRDLAAEAAVNPNTMQKALSMLESEGLLSTQRTSGRMVTENEEIIRDSKKKIAESITADFVKKMESIGITKDEMIQCIMRKGE